MRRMSWIYSVIMVLALSPAQQSCAAKKNLTNNEQVVVSSITQEQNLKNPPAYNDFVQLTSRYSNAPSLELVAINKANLPSAIRQEIKADRFYIDANHQSIKIIAASSKDFTNGIYYALDRLGIQFLGLSDNFIEFPEELNVFEQKQLIHQNFKVRYFGTGGNGRYKVQKTLHQQFKARNQLDDYDVVGHTFSNLYKENKATIDALHKKGKIIFHDYPKKTKNPNFDEPATVELIKKWIEKKYLEKPDQKIIGLAAADGIGNDQGTNSSNPLIVNTMSKYLWIGNEVAKYLNNKYPEFEANNFIGVNAYGAGTGVAKAPDWPSSYKTASNVWVQLAPYAFQKDYEGDLKQSADEKMIADWTTKFPQFSYSMRDYWNITQWTNGIPRTNFFEVTDRVELWRSTGMKSANIESTNFSALTNPHFWVAGKLATNTSLNKEVLYKNYFDTTFKASADDMEAYYQLLSNWKGPISLCEAEELLESAYENAQHPIVENRIIEIMGYMHYVRQFYALTAAKTTDKAGSPAYKKWENEALKHERWAKKLNELGVIQTWAVYNYNYGKHKPWGLKKSPETFDAHLSTSDFQSLKSTILTRFKTGKKACGNQELKFVKQAYTNQRFSVKNPQPFCISPFRQNELITFTPLQTTQLNITIESPKPDAVFELKGSDGTYVDYSDKSNDFVISDIVRPGVDYTLRLGSRKNASKFCFNNTDILFTYKEFAHTSQASGYKRNILYFYVPEHVDEIVFSGLEQAEKNYFTDVFTPDGTLLSAPLKKLAFKEGNTPVYSVPTHTKDFDGRGKVWKIRSWTWKMKVHNFNPIISRQEFEAN